MEYVNRHDITIRMDDIVIKRHVHTPSQGISNATLEAVLRQELSKAVQKVLNHFNINYYTVGDFHVRVSPHDDEWIPCQWSLPEYEKEVLVMLENGSLCITHRTHADYSRDKYDFLHSKFVLDAKFWCPLPKTDGKMIEI